MGLVMSLVTNNLVMPEGGVCHIVRVIVVIVVTGELRRWCTATRMW